MSALTSEATDIRYYRDTVAGFTALVIYDYMIQFDDEIRYLWGRRLTIAGTQLFISRYLPLVTVCYSFYVFCVKPNTVNSCYIHFVIIGVPLLSQYMLSISILFMRGYAIWERSKLIFSILVPLYLATVGVTSYFTALTIKGASISPTSYQNGCIVVYDNNSTWIAFLFMIFGEILAVALLLLKLWSHFRYSDSRSGLLAVMVRDGIGYFICNLAATVANVIISRNFSPSLRNIVNIPQGAIQMLLCSRLLFHVHVASDPTNIIHSESLSTMEFKKFRAERSIGGTLWSNCLKSAPFWLRNVVFAAAVIFCAHILLYRMIPVTAGLEPR